MYPYTYQGGCGCNQSPYRQWPSVLQPIVTYSNQCTPICVYETVGHLRLETVLVQNRVAMTKGLDTPYDTQGHQYIFEVNETAADDGVNYIKPGIIPADQPGRWRLWA